MQHDIRNFGVCVQNVAKRRSTILARLIK